MSVTVGPVTLRAWLAVLAALSATVLAAIWAAGVIAWTLHVVLGVVLALLAFAVALFVWPGT